MLSCSLSESAEDFKRKGEVKKLNRRGVALILSYMVIAILTIFGSVFLTCSISERNVARRYTDSTRAFWIAEAGLAEGYNNQVSTGQIRFGDGTYQIDISDDPDGRWREIKATGIYGSARRVIKAYLPYLLRIPDAFENSVSCGDDMSLRGLWARVDVHGKTRISGTYTQSGATGWFEDKQEGVSQDRTTIRIPDYNNNATGDEFEDFVLFGQEAVASYLLEEVVYIETDGTVNIFPNGALADKKVVFVEGSSPGTGDVNIFFDGSWQEGQDLTVISTGTITYIQPLQYQEDARLSTISWDDYNEASIFRSQHESVMYTHDDANFVDILDWGSTTGNLIANDDISLLEILTHERFYFSDRVIGNESEDRLPDLPPGFEHLCGRSSDLSTNLIDWQEEIP